MMEQMLIVYGSLVFSLTIVTVYELIKAKIDSYSNSYVFDGVEEIPLKTEGECKGKKN